MSGYPGNYGARNDGMGARNLPPPRRTAKDFDELFKSMNKTLEENKERTKKALEEKKINKFIFQHTIQRFLLLFIIVFVTYILMYIFKDSGYCKGDVIEKFFIRRDYFNNVSPEYSVYESEPPLLGNPTGSNSDVMLFGGIIGALSAIGILGYMEYNRGELCFFESISENILSDTTNNIIMGYFVLFTTIIGTLGFGLKGFAGGLISSLVFLFISTQIKEYDGINNPFYADSLDKTSETAITVMLFVALASILLGNDNRRVKNYSSLRIESNIEGNILEVLKELNYPPMQLLPDRFNPKAFTKNNFKELYFDRIIWENTNRSIDVINVLKNAIFPSFNITDKNGNTVGNLYFPSTQEEATLLGVIGLENRYVVKYNNKTYISTTEFLQLLKTLIGISDRDSLFIPEIYFYDTDDIENKQGNILDIFLDTNEIKEKAIAQINIKSDSGGQYNVCIKKEVDPVIKELIFSSVAGLDFYKWLEEKEK